MSELHFAEPQWIHLLWVVAAFVGLLAWLERRGGGDLGRFVASALQHRLVQQTTPLRRAIRLVFLGLCGLFLTLALMRPQWGAQFVNTPRVGAQIMVCLDVSRSMLAEDVAPNRLERAKAELRDLLGYLDGDQVGLIAFAGRAAVLSPLTPDFSFLRLVLDEAGPQSVARGGTRLEEPIRKALAGFRDQGGAGEVSRSILLITDGEDHDSFPMEAAKAAAERGVRIISIGFGDEAGSEILVTDPRTGARTLLRDADGNPVRSRLDGELLREMALVTEGAYIPAGTGALDLESIYQRHIANLTRGRLDGGGYTIRNDAFQWALLFALVCLLAAVASPTVAARSRASGTGVKQVVGIAVTSLLAANLAGFLAPTKVQAQTTDSEPTAETQQAAPVPPSEQTTGAPIDSMQTADTPSEPETPREIYNLALASLNAEELDTAAHGFEDARARAGTDGETRFRATYNLGWVEVKRAGAALESEPKTALQSLQRAGDWFREAIALRPEHEASRHNLELVLRRALALADHLAKREEKDIAAQLDQLIADQRAFLTELGSGVDLAALQDDPSAAEPARRALRTLATRQLELLTQAERLSETAGQELATLQAKPEEERSTEDAVRLAQLGQLLDHMHRAREHMGQARSQLRRLQANRAFRRVADALSALKRARDQLLDPIARLDALVRDGMDLLRQTGQKVALDAQQDQPSPAWLTDEHLGETQSALEARTRELHEGLSAGLAQTREAPATDPATASNAEAKAAQEQLLRRLEVAAPLIDEAGIAFGEARAALEAARAADALEPQRRGVTKLATAREHFLDLKRLVELLHQDEQRIAAFIAPVEQNAEPAPNPAESVPDAHEGSLSTTVEYLPVALELQTANSERLQRISTAILDRLAMVLDAEEQTPDQAQTQQASQTSAATSHAGTPNPLQAERRHLEQADALRVEAEKAMLQAIEDLTATEALPDDAPELSTALEQARQSVALTLVQTETLRHLFFSVIDHLKETLRRQIDLGDRTEEAAGLAETESAEEITRRLGPLAPEQSSLGDMARNIAEALKKQAEQPAPSAPQGQQSEEQEAPLAQENQARVRQAAEQVANAHDLMVQASEEIAGEPPQFETIRGNQQGAVEALTKALAVLQPPQQQEQEPDQQEKRPQGQQAEQGTQDGQPQSAPGDLGQLLQGVRDREAQRRKQRVQRQRHGYEPVEKDW